MFLHAPIPAAANLILPIFNMLRAILNPACSPLKLPDGKLTTMYHYLKEMESPIDTKEDTVNDIKITEEIDA